MAKIAYPAHPEVPISKAVRAGDFVFTSAYGPWNFDPAKVVFDADGAILDDGSGNKDMPFEEQVHRTFAMVKEALAVAGCTLDDVVDCQCWLSDARDFVEVQRDLPHLFRQGPAGALRVPGEVHVRRQGRDQGHSLPAACERIADAGRDPSDRDVCDGCLRRKPRLRGDASRSRSPTPSCRRWRGSWARPSSPASAGSATTASRSRFHSPSGPHGGAGHAVAAACPRPARRDRRGARHVRPRRRKRAHHHAGGRTDRGALAGDAVRADRDRRRALGALGIPVERAFVSDFGYVAICAGPAPIRAMSPDLDAIARLDRGTVIVTAPGDASDIVIRVFAPQARTAGGPGLRHGPPHHRALLVGAARPDRHPQPPALAARGRPLVPARGRQPSSSAGRPEPS